MCVSESGELESFLSDDFCFLSLRVKGERNLQKITVT